ncbi:MAG: ATP-dependent endonuclease [Candidatus Amulumruptor caecigallinarius]|nr:MAG: ATP-dependent endonuclease [Candidatus Amulumruptor caecigallinarius]
MDAEQFALTALRSLPYDPNEQQLTVLAALSRFITMPFDGSDRVFVLNGYAGTGKTSLTGAVVKALEAFSRPVVLLAPTGRAAKVFGRFAGRQAYTIHRHIYRTSSLGEYAAGINDNKLTGAVFLVDEASMIGDGGMDRNLLEDLIHYVYGGIGCRMVLIGDTAQLPPVGADESPAMQPEVLRGYGLKVTRAVMTETVRQSRLSGILWNATWLRKALRQPVLPPPVMLTSRFDDVREVEGEELADAISSDYSRDGVEQTIVVTRSNNRATRFNLSIRTLINMSEEELVRGERIMVAKNNYHWTHQIPGVDFIANGDMAVIESIHGLESRYGLRFADVTLTLPDRDAVVDCKIILDALVTDAPALDGDKLMRLRDGVLAEHGGNMLSPSAAVRILRGDPYFNALQVKYAYAVTCHKAQGGQWKNVYIDLGYVPEDTPGKDFYRWLYTAVTRATGRVNLISPVIETR